MPTQLTPKGPKSSACAHSNRRERNGDSLSSKPPEQKVGGSNPLGRTILTPHNSWAPDPRRGQAAIPDCRPDRNSWGERARDLHRTRASGLASRAPRTWFEWHLRWGRRGRTAGRSSRLFQVNIVRMNNTDLGIGICEQRPTSARCSTAFPPNRKDEIARNRRNTV